MVEIVVEAVHEVEGCPGGAVELEVGCFELEVGSSHKKKEAQVKRVRHWQCDRYHESPLDFGTNFITKGHSYFYIG